MNIFAKLEVPDIVYRYIPIFCAKRAVLLIAFSNLKKKTNI